MDGRPVWRVRVRYVDDRTLSIIERLEVAKWVEATLPSVGALDPVSSMPMADGWTVVLHVHARTGPDAVAAAGELLEVVAGDTARVLGRLVETRAAPGVVRSWR
jgi:uncharacterized membrane protein